MNPIHALYPLLNFLILLPSVTHTNGGTPCCVTPVLCICDDLVKMREQHVTVP
jgi:hypothetical protein